MKRGDDDRNTRSGEPSVLPMGAYGGILTGVVLLVSGLWGFASSAPPPSPLLVALMVLGVADAMASFLALRHSRIGWSFATSINGTIAFFLLLGSPRLRDLFEVHLTVAAIPCLYAILVTTLLALSSAEVKD